jgi:hypothetical protein
VVIGDKSPPIVDITAATLDQVSGIVTVSASASDNHMVRQVVFFVDHVQQDVDTTAPWDFYWVIREIGNQTKHLLQVKAVDAAGNEALSLPVEVIVLSGYMDVIEPTVKIELESQWEGDMGVKFRITFTDASSGINWDSVAVDVFDITGPADHTYEVSRLLLTWVYENDGIAPGDIEFQKDKAILLLRLHDVIARGRRLAIVVYDRTRERHFDEACSCEYFDYDWATHGVPDLAGNHTEVVVEHFTVLGP